MKRCLPIFYYFLVFIVFFLVGYKYIDNDFGWHLRMGELITSFGIPKTDPFSYSMPSYPFVDYEWLTNVIWYKTFPFFRLPVWSIIYSTIAVLTMWIAVPTKDKKYAWIVMLIGWSTMLFRFGVRAQVINWLFWSLLVRSFFDEMWLKKYKWLFPPLMLVWSNLHGSYPMAIAGVGTWYILKSLKDKEINFEHLTIFILGFLATFINPYGWKNWYEVILVMTQGQLLRNSVQEWLPFYNMVDFGLILGIVFVIISIWISPKKWPLWQYVISVWMLWWAVSSLRFAPLFIIFASPIITNFLNDLEKSGAKIVKGKERFNAVYKILLTLATTIFILISFLKIKERILFKEEGIYPKKAIEFLQKNGFQKNIFSEFGWGGYLIWKMPNERYFIDGRMACFKWKAPRNESDQALVEYLGILESKRNLEIAINKYGIKTLLWPKTDYVNKISVNIKINNWIREIFKTKKGTIKVSDKKFLTWWEELGYKKIYEDELSVIYTKF